MEYIQKKIYRSIKEREKKNGLNVKANERQKEIGKIIKSTHKKISITNAIKPLKQG